MLLLTVVTLLGYNNADSIAVYMAKSEKYQKVNNDSALYFANKSLNLLDAGSPATSQEEMCWPWSAGLTI